MKLMVSGATTTVEQLLADPEVVPYMGAMLTPNTANSVTRIANWGLPYCADAGCFPVEAFSASRYMAMVVKLAEAEEPPVFVVVPDVVRMTEEGPVGDYVETMRQFEVWQRRLEPFQLPLAFVAQDGLSDLDDIPWGDIAAVFIGGSDSFKDEMTGDIAAACRARGKWCHLGRVNGKKRLRLALLGDVDSVDGSSLSRFGRTWIPAFARHCKELEVEAAHLDRLNDELEAEVASWDAFLGQRRTAC
jgi:hypothetical protein